MGHITYKIAYTEEEYQGHFAVRHAVFVEEQAVFEGSDRDEHDDDALHIVAIDDDKGQVVGAVRIYPAGDDVWYGGRLAVLPSYRSGSVGSRLCILAEATVVAQRGVQFLAYIQTQNVHYFERLRWRKVGDVVVYSGRPHQLMAASLAAADYPVRETVTEEHVPT